MSPRHTLTQEQWSRIEGLLPGKVGDPGQSGRDNRLFVDAVLFIAKTGVPWRDLPRHFGNWNSIWRRFDRWSAKGVWERVVKELGDVDLEELQLDSTSIKVHLAAVGGRRLAAEKKKMPTVVVGSVVRAEA
jgi:putative transposase